MDDNFFEEFEEYEQQADIVETIQYSSKLYNQYLNLAHPSVTPLGNSNSMSDSGSDASNEEISGDQHACIENYRDLQRWKMKSRRERMKC